MLRMKITKRVVAIIKDHSVYKVEKQDEDGEVSCYFQLFTPNGIFVMKANDFSEIEGHIGGE